MTDLVVAIVGAGIGGTEMAGYLGLHGTRVRVHDIRKEAVGGIRASTSPMHASSLNAGITTATCGMRGDRIMAACGR